jgi:hypothetical protein
VAHVNTVMSEWAGSQEGISAPWSHLTGGAPQDGELRTRK